MRLNKEDLVKMLLDYQGKFNNILDELKNDLHEVKTKYCKLEFDLHISRNINDKLSYKLVVLERKCRANEQYSRTESLKIFAIPSEVGNKYIEKKFWRFWMQSTPQLTRIWLRTAIVYPQNFHQIRYFKTKPPERL